MIGCCYEKWASHVWCESWASHNVDYFCSRRSWSADKCFSSPYKFASLAEVCRCDASWQLCLVWLPSAVVFFCHHSLPWGSTTRQQWAALAFLALGQGCAICGRSPEDWSCYTEAPDQCYASSPSFCAVQKQSALSFWTKNLSCSVGRRVELISTRTLCPEKRPHAIFLAHLPTFLALSFFCFVIITFLPSQHLLSWQWDTFVSVHSLLAYRRPHLRRLLRVIVSTALSVAISCPLLSSVTHPFLASSFRLPWSLGAVQSCRAWLFHAIDSSLRLSWWRRDH